MRTIISTNHFAGLSAWWEVGNQMSSALGREVIGNPSYVGRIILSERKGCRQIEKLKETILGLEKIEKAESA